MTRKKKKKKWNPWTEFCVCIVKMWSFYAVESNACQHISQMSRHPMLESNYIHTVIVHSMNYTE